AGPVERTEIARQRRGGGNESVARRGILANIGSLEPAEEVELVPDDFAAQRAAELVPLQAVLPGREIIDRVRIPVADEFKQMPVPAIPAGLGDRVQDSARMQSVSRRERAGLHAEFRERVRKRERHVDVGEAVVVVPAVEQVVGGIARAAGDGNGLRAKKTLAARIRSIAVIDRCARDSDELRRITAVERQLDDALLIDYLGDRVLLRLHETGIGVYLDRFAHLPDLHRDVDLDIVVDAELNSGLLVRLKTRSYCPQRVRADRQTGQRVEPVIVSDGIMSRAGV